MVKYQIIKLLTLCLLLDKLHLEETAPLWYQGSSWSCVSVEVRKRSDSVP